jgi:ferrous iron transport protein B
MFAMYAIGLVVAPLVALALKRTLLRGETPIFIMEMPLYKCPALGTVVRRMTDSGWAFLRRAGTLILAAMIVVWAFLYFPHTNQAGRSYDELIAELQAANARADTDAAQKDRNEQGINELLGEWKRQSLLGRMGQAIEPAVAPLGWDWRIGVAALASFPAREVVVGTLGIVYKQGKVDSDEIRDARLQDVAGTDLGRALQTVTWDDDPGRKVFTIPVALSLMVFFALCCQCASTLAVIRRETGSWRWPVFTFTYMTILAYIGALAVYQVGRLLV